MERKQEQAVGMAQQIKDADITFEISGNCLIVRIGRDLDHHNALFLRERSDQILDRNNIKNIVFDFSKSNFMDSSGIGVIMGRYKRIIFTGGKIAVTGVGSPVDRIFRISGLYKIIDKFDTIKDAIKSL